MSWKTKSPVDSYLCVCVCVCVCNESTPGKAVNRAHQMCLCLCTHKIKGGHECVYMRVSSSLSHQKLLVYLCICSYTNTAEGLRLHKAVTLLLIMKYFVLKMISYSHTTAPCNLLSNPRKKKSNAFTWYANYHPTINNKGSVSKNLFFECWSKLFKNKKMNTMWHWFVENVNWLYLLCKWLLYCQALSPDMQIVILL